MVDAADPEKIEASKNELHNLLDKPQLQGIPVRTTTQLTQAEPSFPTEPDLHKHKADSDTWDWCTTWNGNQLNLAEAKQTEEQLSSH